MIADFNRSGSLLTQITHNQIKFPVNNRPVNSIALYDKKFPTPAPNTPQSPSKKPLRSASAYSHPRP